jgi:hypothetical protein
LRPRDQFLARHFVRSINVPVFAEDRLGELPNRFRRFAVVVSTVKSDNSVVYDSQTTANLDFLALHRYNPRPLIPIPAPGSPDEQVFWDSVPKDLVTTGHSTHMLFSPSPGLERNIDQIEAGLAKSFPRENWQGVDLGSGAGRDALFLLSRGLEHPEGDDAVEKNSKAAPRQLWSLTGVDHLPRALRKATNLIERYLLPLKPAGVMQRDDSWTLTKRWEPVQAEFKRDGRVRLWPPDVEALNSPALAQTAVPFYQRQYHLVTASRFLPPRAFWPILENMVRPNGGCFLICTFVEGTYHPVHPDNYLYKGELRRFLEPRGWTVEVEEEETTEEGKLVVVFLARRGNARIAEEREPAFTRGRRG